MAEKLRRMVMRRAALCARVLGAARVQGPEIGVKLGEFLSPVLTDGEVLPDQASTLELYARKLESFRDAMVDSDADYLAQRAILADVTSEAEVPAKELKSSILSLRSTCEGLLGKESLRSLGLDFLIAQEPQGLLRQGEIIRERLLSSESELTPGRWVKNPLARQELADELDEEIAELRIQVKRLVEQRKVVDTAKVRKDQTQEEFDRQFILIVRVLETVFRVAGETELADRIRPTVRQLGREGGETPDQDELEAPSEDESSPEVPLASTGGSSGSEVETAANAASPDA